MEKERSKRPPKTGCMRMHNFLPILLKPMSLRKTGGQRRGRRIGRGRERIKVSRRQSMTSTGEYLVHWKWEQQRNQEHTWKGKQLLWTRFNNH